MNDGPVNDLTRDAFLGGRLHIWQPRKGYRAATDPVLLAAAVPAKQGQSVLELGCGAGTAILCLASRIEGLDAKGLELQLFYANLARRNATENQISLEVFDGDLAAFPDVLREQVFDQVLANPPFYEQNNATVSVDAGRDLAHREGDIGLGDWIDAGLKRLKPKGYLTVIHRTERLGEILQALDRRAGDIRILPLASRAGRPAGRVIVQARKAAKAPLRLLAPFILHDGKNHIKDGVDFTPQAEEVLRFGKELDLSLAPVQG